MGINQVTDLVKEGGKVADNLTTTKEEQEQFRSDRQAADMTSDNQLAKSIRPISLLISWTIIIAMAAATMYKIEIDPWIMGEFLAMHGTILSFYFYSRRGEKIAEKNAKANIVLQRDKQKHEDKMEKKRFRREKRNKS
jgi:hypothetical protein